MARNSNSAQQCKSANTQTIHWLKAGELLESRTLCCPPLDSCIWNSHPRVFLRLDAEDKAQCSYCGTCYRLRED